MTGFSSESDKKEIERKVTDMKWHISMEEFDTQVTHVISPVFQILTMKSLAASLTYLKLLLYINHSRL